ncbi:Pentatricopeptide repeat-containing protein [Apostasia shenzhenica]|uniref:Pentatricopeptide repeat-containing protein n=1 Tax=Apostasia shenzhenica TaxID=1088818 RepID=A0A2I0BBL0_9ASPA|nr:Pentatricopeptide repeat-containing protein [Apostasia shenzhenica]
MAALLRNPRIVYSLERFSTATAAHEPSSSSASGSSISRIKTSIRGESKPDRLAELFQSAATTPTFYGDRIIYSITIQKLAHARRIDLIERLLEQQLADPSTPKSEGFFTRIISLYGKSGMPDHAASAFNRFPSRRSERSLCALLNAFFKSHQHARLRETFNQAKEVLGVSPGIASYNVLLKSLCEDGNVAAARAMLDEMPKREMIPDIVSYNMVLNGYLKERNEEGFEELLKELSVRNLVANVSTYNCRIAWLCSKGRSFEAGELLDAVDSVGIQPNRVSFVTLIAAFCKNGEARAAMNAFRRMQAMKNGVSGSWLQNFTAYPVLISCLVEKEEFDSALEILKLCLRKNCLPPLAPVKDLIQVLIKKSRVKEAKDFVGKMRKAVRGDAIDAWRKIEGEFSL